MWIVLKAKGKTFHANRPWQGNNAINKPLLTINRVHNIFLDATKHDDSHWATTCNIGNIRGGESTNIVPDQTVAVCDIRHIEKILKNDIKRIQDALPDSVTANQTVTVTE